MDAATIPAPANVHYEKSTRRASSTVDDTQLHLTAKIELENDDGTWRCGFNKRNLQNLLSDQIGYTISFANWFL